MVTQQKAIIQAFEALGGVRSIQEIQEWVTKEYGKRWKDFGTPMADMVVASQGGNKSSTVPDQYRILLRESPGRYYLNRGIRHKKLISK